MTECGRCRAISTRPITHYHIYSRYCVVGTAYTTVLQCTTTVTVPRSTTVLPLFRPCFFGLLLVLLCPVDSLAAKWCLLCLMTACERVDVSWSRSKMFITQSSTKYTDARQIASPHSTLAKRLLCQLRVLLFCTTAISHITTVSW